MPKPLTDPWSGGSALQAVVEQLLAQQPEPPQDPMTAMRKAETIGPVRGGRNLPTPKQEQDPILFLMGLLGNPLENANPAGMTAAAPVAGAMDALAEQFPRVAKAIKAFHGSPHDFEKFSLEKIGTGEGAQAYGHGLYFAENEGVAQAYRNQGVIQHGLNKPQNIVTVAGRRLADMPEFTALDASVRQRVESALSLGADRAKALKTLEYQRTMNQDKPAALDAIDRAKRFIETIPAEEVMHRPPSKGQMYEVQINADPEHFLDYDAPVSAAQAQAGVKSLGNVQPVRLASGHYGITRVGPDGSGRIIQGINEATPEAALATLKRSFDGIKGRDMYTVLSGIHGDATAATEGLKQAGIPGIKYLDQGSRAAGEGSRNYVVFDDSLVTILKKYGLAAPAIELLRRKAQHNGGMVSKRDIDGAM